MEEDLTSVSTRVMNVCNNSITEFDICKNKLRQLNLHPKNVNK